MNVPKRISRLLAGLIVLILSHSNGLSTAQAQDALYLVTPNTTVRKMTFRFPDRNPTFEAELLEELLVTVAPSFWNRFDKINPFKKARTYPFDAIELQKDVARLRQFYKNNGFPTPRISYSTSQFNAANDNIHVIFTIWEGEPMFVQNMTFELIEDSDLNTNQELRKSWTRFRDDLTENNGQRYTEVEQLRLKDLILKWLQNQGFAFAKVEAEISSSGARGNTTEARGNAINRAVSLNFLITPGPRGYFTDIELEGNETVTNKVLLRELPYEPGDLFSSTKLKEGQQQLFGLNLFRVVLADIPEQPVDSTVQIRIRVNEGKRRFISAETGYALQEGIILAGEWTHRNFLGSARNLSLNMRANTGLLSGKGNFTSNNSVSQQPPRLFVTSASLRQPYLFTTHLSGIFSTFIRFETDPQLAASNDFLDINRREAGFSSTLIYDLMPFRPLSLQYTLSQSLSRQDENLVLSSQARDIYGKSVLTLNATFGRLNNYINPRSGFLVKPFAETAGLFISSGINYNKLGIEATGYLPITRKMILSGRLFAGKLWPTGSSKRALNNRNCLRISELGSGPISDLCQLFENRFDPAFFYAGGSNDVRGWEYQLLGPKIARADTLKEDGIVQTDADGNPIFRNFYYERIGGTAKLMGNIEARMRIPGFGPSWQGVAFFDFGQVSNGSIKLNNFKYSAGTGIRYRTIVGFIRLDLAYKINPDDTDLTHPEDQYRYTRNLVDTAPSQKFFRRFALHLSIGQAF